MTIGIAGTGRMGTAIATRLLQEGHTVNVWNRTAENLAPLVDLGAVATESPAALASAVDSIITVLTDTAAIDSVYAAEQGILSVPLSNKLIIDMSTVLPETTQTLAQRVVAKGGAFVECPVGGTVAPALAGKLIGFIGGETTDVARARPLLQQLCRRLEHVGPAGSGAKMKLAINLPLVVYWQALGEALTLCGELDIDSAQLVDIFADTSGGPTVLKNRADVVARALDGEMVAGTFDIDQMRKDLRIMLDEADNLKTRLPLASATLESLDESASSGITSADGSVHSAWWRDRAKSVKTS